MLEIEDVCFDALNTIKRFYTKARQTLAISHRWDLFYVKEIMLRLKIEFK